MPELKLLITTQLPPASSFGFSLGGNTYSRNKITLSGIIRSFIRIFSLRLVFRLLFQDLFDLPKLIR